MLESGIKDKGSRQNVDLGGYFSFVTQIFVHFWILETGKIGIRHYQKSHKKQLSIMSKAKLQADLQPAKQP